MSTVIRDGIIRISLQQGTVELRAPAINQVLAQRDAEVRSVEKLQEAINEASVADSRSATTRTSNSAAASEAYQQTRQQVNQTAEAFGQLTSAAAIFLSNTDDGFQQLIRTLAIAQGGLNLIRASLVLAPQLAPLVAVVSALGVAWRLVADNAEDAKKEALDYERSVLATTLEGMKYRLEAVDRMKDFTTELERQQVLQERINTAERANKELGIAQKDGKGISDAFGEILSRQVLAGIDAQREQLQIATQIKDSEIARLDLLKRQTEESERAAAIEAEKLRTFQAQIGSLDRGEQRRLERLARKIDSEGTAGLSRNDLDFIGRNGGDRGRDLSQDELSRRFQNSAGAGVIGRVFGNNRQEGPSEAVQAIEAQQRDTIDAFNKSRDQIRAAGRDLIETLAAVRTEMSRIKTAMQGQ